MTSKDYSVQALGVNTPAGRLAYDTVYGDFIRLIRHHEDFKYDERRIRKEIRKNVALQDAAQAFLLVFDRYRAFLASLRDRGVKDKLVNRLFTCPPSGVILKPAWDSKYYCMKLICPWCRHRQILQLSKDPWAPLTEEVHIYRRTYEANTFPELNDMRKLSQRERHLFLRKVEAPFIRFQRVGLEVRDGRCFFRMLQLVVFKESVGEQQGWEDCLGTYDRVLELAFRYSAANLIVDRDWDLLGELLGLNRFRRVELSRT